MTKARERPRTSTAAAAVGRPARWLTGRPLFKAGAILNEYTSTLYFPVHGLSWADKVRVWPRLLLLEYLVYRVDAIAERNRHNDLDATRTRDYARLHRYKDRFAALLRGLGAWGPASAQLLDDAEAFARLENASTARSDSSEQALRRVAELRPTDVRLLHSATLAMLGRPDQASLRAALWPVEVLADIANDLEHYDRDVAQGDFNVLLAYQQLFGADAELRLRAVVDQHQADFARATQVLDARQREAVTTAGASLLRNRLDRLTPLQTP